MRFCLNIIRKIITRVTSSKRYQNVRSDLTILGPFANVTLTLCVSWVSPYPVNIFFSENGVIFLCLLHILGVLNGIMIRGVRGGVGMVGDLGVWCGFAVFFFVFVFSVTYALGLRGLCVVSRACV